MSQFFFNQRPRLVDDVIESTSIDCPWNNLARLENDPTIRVVVRRDLNKSNVPSSPAAAPAMSRAHVVLQQRQPAGQYGPRCPCGRTDFENPGGKTVRVSAFSSKRMNITDGALSLGPAAQARR